MREIPLLLYYLMVAVIWLYALALFISYFDKEKNKIQSDNDKEIKDMPWRSFEKQIADCFVQRGWEKRLGPGTDDDGIDIEVWRDGNLYLIQCKHWFGDWIVRPYQIREFYGSVKLYNKKHNTKAKGIFITTGSTTEKARETANNSGIYLRDRLNWKRNVNHFQG